MFPPRKKYLVGTWTRWGMTWRFVWPTTGWDFEVPLKVKLRANGAHWCKCARLIKQTRVSVTTPVFPFFTNMFCFWMHRRVNLNIWKWSSHCWQEWHAHTSGNAKQDKQADDGLIGAGGDNGGWMPHLSALRLTLNMAVMCDVRHEHPGAIPTEEVVEGWRQDQREIDKEWHKGLKFGQIGSAGNTPTAKSFGIICKSHKLTHHFD